MLSILALLFGGLALSAFALGGGSSSDDGGASAAATVPTDTGDDPDDDASTPAASSTPAALVITTDPEPDDIDAPDSTSSGNDSADSPTTPNLPDSAYDIGWDGLSAEEQLIVELVNRARLDPNAEVERLDDDLSEDSSSTPTQALAVVETLSNAAEAHSEDMDDRDFFSHTDPDGGLPWDRTDEAGHENRFVGENIGWIGSSSTNFDEQVRAEAHHANLWNSDGHQENLLSASWSEIGLGYDYGDYRGLDGSTFVTELFGNTGETYLTGVVIKDGDSDEFYDIGEGQGDVRITAIDENDNVFTTSTWDSGGYTLELPSGTYRVTFEGGDLDQPVETSVTIGNENVKLDVIDQAASLTLSALPDESGPTEADVMALFYEDEDMPEATIVEDEAVELALF